MKIWNLYEDLKTETFWKFETFMKIDSSMKIWSLYKDLKPLWKFENWNLSKIWNLYEDLTLFWRFEAFMKIWNLYETLMNLFIQQLRRVFFRYLKPVCKCIWYPFAGFRRPQTWLYERYNGKIK